MMVVREIEFELALSNIANQCDVLFIGADGEDTGIVVAKAGPAGQRVIEKLFPGGLIGWRELDVVEQTYFPPDRREFYFVVPDLLDLPDHGLRRELLTLRPIEKFSPDQFAFLMMSSVNHQGNVRAAIYSISE
jgi:hypothetical protein